MARIRSIHPGLATDEAYMSMSVYCKAAWPLLWTECDDHGVFEWKPLVLKARIFPVDSVSFEQLLTEWDRGGSIKTFESNGKKYAAIKNFCKYQRPKKPVYVHDLPEDLKEFVGLDARSPEFELRRAKHAAQGGRCYFCNTSINYYRKRSDSLELDHLMPRSRGGSDDPSNLAATCRTCNRSKCDMSESEYREWLAKNNSRNANSSDKTPKTELSPQMEDEGWKREEELKEPVEQTNSHCAVADATRTERSQFFEDFWKVYPKRKGANPKHPAQIKFVRAIAGSPTAAATIIVAAGRYCKEMRDLGKHDTEMVAQAVTWLDEKRWLDYAVTPTESPAGLSIRPNTHPGQWIAWRSHRINSGESVKFMDSVGASEGSAFSVPSEWPPDFPAKEHAA